MSVASVTCEEKRDDLDCGESVDHDGQERVAAGAGEATCIHGAGLATQSGSLVDQYGVRRSWWLMVMSMPVIPLGVGLGWRLHEGLDQKQLYRLCYGLLAITALKLLWG